MSKVFINGGNVDKIDVTNAGESTDIKFRVTSDSKAKRSLVELEIELKCSDGHKEVILKKEEISKKKDNCSGFIKFQVPYGVDSVRIATGVVKKLV